VRGPAPATLLRHRQGAEVHLDLVLGLGAACPTLGLDRRDGRWIAVWKSPHRRRYLAYSGPLGAGRGTVAVVWRGVAAWWRTGGGWELRLGGLGRLRLRGLSGGSLVASRLPATIAHHGR